MRTVLLPIVLLGGCWPYIPGSVDDYVDGDGDTDTVGPDALTLVGGMSLAVVQGGYWTEPDRSFIGGTVLMGFVEGGGVRPLDDFGEVGTCGRPPETLILDAAIDAGGPDTITLQGSGDITLDWYGDTNRMYFAEVPDAAYGTRVDWSLLPFDIDAGRVDPGEVVRTPRLATITWPPVSGNDIAAVPRRDTLDVEWEATIGQHTTLVQVLPVNDNLDVIGEVVCSVEPGHTVVTVPTSEASGWDRAVAAYVNVALCDEGDVPLGDDVEGRARI